MEFGVKAGSLEKHRSGCIVAGVYAGRKLSPSAMELDAASRGFIDTVVKRDFEGRLGATLVLHDVSRLAAERVLLVGLGRPREFLEDGYHAAIAAALKALVTTKAADATFCLPELSVKGRDIAWKVEQAVIAVMEGLYRFDGLKSKPPPESKRALKKVLLRVADGAETPVAKAAIERGAAIAEGVALAKDLGNLPGNVCTPAYLAEQAVALGKRHDLKVEVLDQKDIAKLGMGAFLAVARGSRQPPKLIVMEYRGGARAAPPVALVGKGITFDTGGISIKPALEMDEMKFDMCGAASVFGALRAAALMKLPLNVVGIVPSAENMPGGNAVKPGDIVTTMSGQTVEILDTDHEGRLVLSDALTYTERYKPAAVIDIATLTDSIVIALGDVASGVFANDDALAREILEAGERAWDRAWHLPLWDAYQEKLESNFADFPNVVAHGAGAITAACFLSRFTKRVPWAHLDIAGTASRSGDEKGATGRPVALLAHFLARRAGAAARPG